MGKKKTPKAYFIELTKTMSLNWPMIFLEISKGIRLGRLKIKAIKRIVVEGGLANGSLLYEFSSAYLS